VFLHEALEKAPGPFRVVRAFLLQWGYRQSAYVAHCEGSGARNSQSKPFDVTVELPRKKERGFQCRVHEIMLLGRNENGLETHGRSPTRVRRKTLHDAHAFPSYMTVITKTRLEKFRLFENIAQMTCWCRVGLFVISSGNAAHRTVYAVNLGGHDEIVLMQSLDLLGLQRDRGIAPTEVDIRMMAFSFREFHQSPGQR
jgi:hypothetical protein